MKTKSKARKKALAEEEIDQIVESQADDDEAWEEPVQVSAKQPASLTLPTNLAARAAFLAKLHRERDMRVWLKRIITERIALEESAFIAVCKCVRPVWCAQACLGSAAGWKGVATE